MYSPSSKLVLRQFFNCCFVLFCRCALCRSVVDSYDSLNVKYGLNGQVVFARVNVEKLKVSDIKLTQIYFLLFARSYVVPSSYFHFLSYVVVLVNLFHLKHARTTDSLRGRRQKMNGREGRRGGEKWEREKRETEVVFLLSPIPTPFPVLFPPLSTFATQASDREHVWQHLTE